MTPAMSTARKLNRISIADYLAGDLSSPVKYRWISSLAVYVQIEQDEPLVVTYRPTEHGIAHGEYHGLDAVLPLRALSLDVPLSEIFGNVQFSPEPEENDAAGS